MIINSAVYPFADERRNRARADMFLPEGTLLRSFAPEEVLEVSLIQEFHKNQTAVPRSEISITFDNHNKYFDVANPESAVHSLSKRHYCEAFFSSVEYGMPDSFVKKCRYFYDSFTDGNDTFSLRFTDAVSHSIFERRYMTNVFVEIGETGSATAKEILEGVKLETEYNIEYDVSDEINEKMRFAKSSFYTETEADSIKTGLFNMASRFTTSFKSPIYFIIDDEGKLTFRKQQTTVSATITKKHFTKCEFRQGEECLISVISDRGNILYQLGDIIEVVDGDKIFKTEIYKIHYKLSNNGSLSSEWEGVVMQ